MFGECGVYLSVRGKSEAEASIEERGIKREKQVVEEKDEEENWNVRTECERQKKARYWGVRAWFDKRRLVRKRDRYG